MRGKRRQRNPIFGVASGDRKKKRIKENEIIPLDCFHGNGKRYRGRIRGEKGKSLCRKKMSSVTPERLEKRIQKPQEKSKRENLIE